METFESLNPATGDVIAEHCAAAREEVFARVENLRAGSKQWELESQEGRIERLSQFACLLDEKKEEISRLMTTEMGKPIVESRGEMADSVGRVRWFCENALRVLRSREVHFQNVTGTVYYRPYGVVGAIKPWNFPVSIPLWSIVPALLAGNTVLFKPSEYTTLLGEKITEILFQAGVPDTVFQMVKGAESTGKAIVSSGVDKIAFVGSQAAGETIYRDSANTFRSLVLELGGKDAMIVLEDADIDVAVAGAVKGGFRNCGQVCCSVENIFVHRNLYEKFKEELLCEVGKLRLGNGLEEDVTLGPMVREEQRRLLMDQVTDAVEKGSQLLTGGRVVDGPGYFFEPTVLEGMPESARLFREEGFGPVVTLRQFSDIDDVIREIDDSGYGLTTTLYGTNGERMTGLAKRIRSGTIGINKPIGSIVAYPWGGCGRSGVGRMLGEEGIKEFTETIVIR